MTEAGKDARLVESESKDLGAGETTCRLCKMKLEVGSMF